jgi:hypothetical protein
MEHITPDDIKKVEEKILKRSIITIIKSFNMDSSIGFILVLDASK